MHPMSAFVKSLHPNTIMKPLVTMVVLAGASVTPLMAAPVENFGQSPVSLAQAFAQRHLHILQLGDSHTAGDYFTEQLRKRLQADIGDGGVGFAYPMPVKGQRTARHGYQSSGWQLSNSRVDRQRDYPLGGMLAQPSSRGDDLILTSQTYAGDQQQASVVIKGIAGQTVSVTDTQGTRQLTLSRNGWQTLSTPITFPTTFHADPQTAVGGFWLDRGTGGRVSALGINGATQDYWRRWHQPLTADLTQSHADLVILAYGTNEAFQNQPASQLEALQEAITQIRQALPNAAILLVNAPESLKQTAGQCGTRSPSLDTVQANIKQLAKANGTLHWSWQDAMGGRCSMKSWIAQGLGRADGVHFTKEGYEKAANDLYDNLRPLFQSRSVANFPSSAASISPAINNTNQSRSSIYRTATSPDVVTISNQTTYRPTSQPKAVICNSNNDCTTLKP